MGDNKTLGKLSTLTFVGITCSFVGSIRNIPDVAVAGWTMIFYLIVGAFLFALPIILIAAEFAGMFVSDGGMELWVTNSIGKKWGFVVSWLLWVQMFPAMVLMASSLPPLIGVIIGNRALGLNSFFNFAVIVIVYWTITILNLKFDMVKICGKIGIWFGLYIPLAMMMIMGIAVVIKVGLVPESTLGAFEASKLIPDMTTRSSLQYFTPIMFIFIGQEMSAVYIKRLERPSRTYLIGAVSALLFIFFLNLINSMILADVVPKGQIQLDNTAQSIEIYARILGLPQFLANIFSAFVFIGIMVQITAWATGPAKTIISSAKRGLYPPKFKFWKVNKLELSDTVMFTQATVISIFAVLFLVIPNINRVILVLANAAVVQYSIAYIILGISIYKIRKEKPDIKRPFKLGGDRFLLFVIIVLFSSIIISTVFTFITSNMVSNITVTVITALMFAAPLIINKKRDVKWEKEVAELVSKHEGLN